MELVQEKVLGEVHVASENPAWPSSPTNHSNKGTSIGVEVLNDSLEIDS